MSHTSKYLNLIQSGVSFLVSSALQKPVVFGIPPAISIELTNHCNLRCPECPSGSGAMTRGKGFMDPSLFKDLIKDLKSYLFNINLYFQGEPMLHPDFFSFLRIAESIPTTVSTNGHYLTADSVNQLIASGLSKLVISLDGIDQETYSAYRRNGNVDKVTGGISILSGALKNSTRPMRVEVQVLVNSYNETQIGEIGKFVSEKGFTLSLKSMQIYSGSSFDEWLPARRNFRRYIVKDGVYKIKGSLPNRCARLWFNPVITWDGKVLPCCFDKDADHVMGDLNMNSFREIWHGEKYKVFRKAVLVGREKIPVCRNCTSGLRGVKF